MDAFRLTPHAISRMAQRGIGLRDADLIKYIGTQVEGGYLVRVRDFQALDRELKQLRDHARRLVGKRVVTEGDLIVTAYHAGRSKRRHLIRTAL